MNIDDILILQGYCFFLNMTHMSINALWVLNNKHRGVDQELSQVL